MPTLAKDAPKVCFQRSFRFGAVNEDGFSDVTILTGGTEAEGHGLFVDEAAIAQAMTLLMGATLPAYLTHDDAWEDRLGEEIGIFSGFYREGLKIKAKTFKFLRSFMANDAEDYEKLVELAQVMPDQFGTSIVFQGDCVWPCADGTEVCGMYPKPDNCSADMPCIRFGKIESCDFVKSPAVNDGLFQAHVDGKPQGKPIMANDSIALSAHSAALAAKDGELAVLSQQHKDAVIALEAKHASAVSAFESKINDQVAALAKAKVDSDGLTAALAAKSSEADEAAKYDMRKAGAGALEIALSSRGPALPEPARSDSDKWNQYSALCEAKTDQRGNIVSHVETPAAKAFREKYLARK